VIFAELLFDTVGNDRMGYGL